MSFVPLDQVLGLAPGAMVILVEMPRTAPLQAGHDITDIGTFRRRLDPRHDPPGSEPGFRGVAGGRELSHFVQLPNRTLDIACVERGEYPRRQDRVRPEPEDVVYVVAFASIHGLGPPVVAVSADQDARLRPVQTDTPHQPAQMLPDLLAPRGFAGTRDRRHAMPGIGIVDMDGCEAPLVPMGVDKRHLPESGNSVASRPIRPRRLSAPASRKTPPSEPIVPPSNAAVPFFLHRFGSVNGRSVSSPAAGVADSVRGWRVASAPNS